MSSLLSSVAPPSTCPSHPFALVWSIRHETSPSAVTAARNCIECMDLCQSIKRLAVAVSRPSLAPATCWRHARRRSSQIGVASLPGSSSVLVVTSLGGSISLNSDRVLASLGGEFHPTDSGFVSSSSQHCPTKASFRRRLKSGPGVVSRLRSISFGPSSHTMLSL